MVGIRNVDLHRAQFGIIGTQLKELKTDIRIEKKSIPPEHYSHIMSTLKQLDRNLQECAKKDYEFKRQLLAEFDAFQKGLAPTIAQTFSRKFLDLRTRIEKLVQDEESELESEESEWQKIVRISKGGQRLSK